MMLLGLPVETWILLAVATVPGLVLVVRAHRVHGRRRGGGEGPGERGAGPAGPGVGPEGRGFPDEGKPGPDRV